MLKVRLTFQLTYHCLNEHLPRSASSETKTRCLGIRRFSQTGSRVESRIDVDTRDNAYTVYDATRVATILFLGNQCYFFGILFLQDGVIKDDVSIAGLHHIRFDMFPDGAGCEIVACKIAVYLIMAKSLRVFCEMRQRIVDRCAE